MKAKGFCIAFLAALLALPVSFAVARNYIDTTNYENREYAPFPELSLKTFGVFPYGFERYLNDHLPYKNQLTRLNAQLEDAAGLNNTMLQYFNTDSVIHGKDGWLFYNASGYESTINDYLCNNLYDEAELQRLAAGYQALNDKYRDQGITFVLMIPTNKEQVYPEYMPDALQPTGTESRTDQLVTYLKEHTTVPVVYTKEALLGAKQDAQVFYKYDSHWNQPGAFVGEQLLREVLQGEKDALSEYEIKELPDRFVGDLATVSGMQDTLYEYPAEVIGYKPDVTATLTSEEDSAEATMMSYVSDAPDQRKLLMIKDSYFYSMLPFLSKDFGETLFTTDSTLAKELIAERHPDIVVLEIVERHFYRAEHQWEELLQ